MSKVAGFSKTGVVIILLLSVEEQKSASAVGLFAFYLFYGCFTAHLHFIWRRRGNDERQAGDSRG